MIATSNVLLSPRDNPWSSPPKDHKACLSLSFPSEKDYGLWNSPDPMKPDTNTPTEQSWGTTATITPLDLSAFLETPSEIEIPHEWSDDVSLLNDNPEEDDIEVLYLPQSTYDVLMPLFDELYIGTEDERQDQEATTVAS